MTITYAKLRELGSEDFLVDGFLDWSTAEKGDHASELNWTTWVEMECRQGYFSRYPPVS